MERKEQSILLKILTSRVLLPKEARLFAFVSIVLTLLHYFLLIFHLSYIHICVVLASLSLKDNFYAQFERPSKDIWLRTRAMRKERVQDELKWGEVITDVSTYYFLTDIVVYVICPLICYDSLEDYTILNLLGALIICLDVIALYIYYQTDFLQFMEHLRDLIFHRFVETEGRRRIGSPRRLREATSQPTRFRVMESTPDYIKIQNISNEEQVLDFELKRVVDNVSDISVKIEEDTRIPPGAVVKIATVEFREQFETNEFGFYVRTLRSFGPNVGKKVITSIIFTEDDVAIRSEREEFYETADEYFDRTLRAAGLAAAAAIRRRGGHAGLHAPGG